MAWCLRGKICVLSYTHFSWPIIFQTQRAAGGLAKHQLWANARCLWVNFVRLLNVMEEPRLSPSFFTNNLFAQCVSYFYALQSSVMGIFPNRYANPGKFNFYRFEKSGCRSGLNNVRRGYCLSLAFPFPITAIPSGTTSTSRFGYSL